MITSLDIDADLLRKAEEIAGKEGRNAGAVISEWARRGAESNRKVSDARTLNGVRFLPSRGERITSSHVRKLMDEEGI